MFVEKCTNEERSKFGISDKQKKPIKISHHIHNKYQIVLHKKNVNVSSLMTYVDSRVGIGDGYLRAGWKFEKTTSASRFWWTDFHHRYDRFKYKADKSRCMTQQQIADEAGVVPIYGCTNSIMKIDL